MLKRLGTAGNRHLKLNVSNTELPLPLIPKSKAQADQSPFDLFQAVTIAVNGSSVLSGPWLGRYFDIILHPLLRSNFNYNFSFCGNQYVA